MITPDTIRIRFLGTGAADWSGPKADGELRRMTSTLLDGTLLIDLTEPVIGSIPADAAVTDILITHSHADHFDPKAIARLAPVRVYADAGWAGKIRIEGADIRPVTAGVPFEAAGFTVIPTHGNHSTEGAGEHTVHYLLKKSGCALYYATDGAWLMYPEARLIRENPLDALVIDATVGDGHDGDYRVFEHNSLDMVRIMVRSMRQSGMLKPGAPVFLTHLARTLHGGQAELEAALPAPFVVCRDGLACDIRRRS